MTTENTVAAELNTIQGAHEAVPVSVLPAEALPRLEPAGQEVLSSAEPDKKSRPLVVLAATVVGCLAVGLTAGWIIGFRRSR